jgi:hypothetical protein
MDSENLATTRGQTPDRPAGSEVSRNTDYAKKKKKKKKTSPLTPHVDLGDRIPIYAAMLIFLLHS